MLDTNCMRGFIELSLSSEPGTVHVRTSAIISVKRAKPAKSALTGHAACRQSTYVRLCTDGFYMVTESVEEVLAMIERSEAPGEVVLGANTPFQTSPVPIEIS